MTNQKILEIRYRNPSHMLEIFWAEDVFEVGTGFRFIGCRVMRIVTIKGSDLFKNYHEKLEVITIPRSLTPVSDVTDVPEWWNRSQREAQDELKLIACSPIAMGISHRLSHFTENLNRWLEHFRRPSWQADVA